MGTNYLLGVVSNAFAGTDLANKLSKGEASSSDILNFTLGIEGTLTNAGILVVGGVTATAASPLFIAATFVGVATVALNYNNDQNMIQDYIAQLTDFLSDPAVVDSVHKAFESGKGFDINYAPELNITPKMINELHMSVADQINLFGAINPNITPEIINKINETLSGGGSVNSSIILSSGMVVYDPLILDLDGDGVETVGLDKVVLFDHAADGTKNATGWVGKNDGLLVRDINNNGTIDTGRELLGDNTILNNGQKAKNAYEALADLDSNKDGVLNNQDAKYSELKVWQDANQDGISQSNELKTLQDAGIASLKVSPTNTTTTTLINGNSQAATSTYTKTDGTTGISAGINFAGDEFVREFTTKVDTSQVASLPDMQASGSVRDLREAAAISSDLATKLQTYANSTNRTSTDLDSLVKTWASTSNMQTLASGLKPGGHPVGGRGTNLTQEEIYKLNVIEKFTGYYGGVVNFKDPAADLANGRYSGTFLGIQLDAAAINKNYDQLLRSVDASISVQTNLKEAMNDVLFKFSADGVTLDLSNLYAKVTGDNPAKAVGDVVNLYAYFKDTASDLFPVTSPKYTN